MNIFHSNLTTATAGSANRG